MEKALKGDLAVLGSATGEPFLDSYLPPPPPPTDEDPPVGGPAEDAAPEGVILAPLILSIKEVNLDQDGKPNPYDKAGSRRYPGFR